MPKLPNTNLTTSFVENKYGKFQYVASISSKRKKNQPEQSFWRDFVMSISEPEHTSFGFTKKDIRKSNRTEKKPSHRFKTTKEGRIVDTHDPNHMHQYTTEQKNSTSKPRSMSLIAPTQNFPAPVFGEYWEKIRGEKGELVGVIISTNDPEKESNVLPTHIFWRNSGTIARPYFNASQEGMKKYFQEEMLPSVSALISKNHLEENNEILARVRWGENARIGIFLDNLKSRIMGQMRAIDMQNISGKSVEIAFYNRELEASQAIYDYDETQQQTDLIKALKSTQSDIKTMALMTECLKDTNKYKELENNLDSLELKKHFLYLLTNGYLSYITEKNVLENFLDINLSILTPTERVVFLETLNKKLIENTDKLSGNLKQFMTSYAKETLAELGYNSLQTTNTQPQNATSAQTNIQEQEELKAAQQESSVSKTTQLLDKLLMALQDTNEAEPNDGSLEEPTQELTKVLLELYPTFFADIEKSYEEPNNTITYLLESILYLENINMLKLLYEAGLDIKRFKSTVPDYRWAFLSKISKEEHAWLSHLNVVPDTKELETIPSKESKTTKQQNNTEREQSDKAREEANTKYKLDLELNRKQERQQIIQTEKQEFKTLTDQLSKAQKEAKEKDKRLQELKLKTEKANAKYKLDLELNRKQERQQIIQAEKQEFTTLTDQLSKATKELQKKEAKEKAKKLEEQKKAQQQKKKPATTLSLFPKKSQKQYEDPFIIGEKQDIHDPFSNESGSYQAITPEEEYSDPDSYGHQSIQRLNRISQQFAGLGTRQPSMEDFSEEEDKSKKTTQLSTGVAQSYTSDQSLIKELLTLIDRKNSEEVKKFLDKYPKLLNCQDADGNTIVHNAVKTGDRAFLYEIINKYKPNCDIPNSHGNTPLFLTASYGKADLAKILLDNGADPNHKNKKQVSIKDQANNTTIRANNPVAQLLIEYTTQQQSPANQAHINQLKKVLQEFEQHPAPSTKESPKKTGTEISFEELPQKNHTTNKLTSGKK